MKKVLSMVLALCMFCSTFMVVGAASDEATAGVLVYQSFDGFNGTRNDESVPEGFVAYPHSVWQSKNNVAGVDGETGSAVDVLNAQYGASLVYPLSKIIRSGKVHWGVDVKMQDPSKSGLYFQAINAMEDENIHDWYNADGGMYLDEYYTVGKDIGGQTFDGKAYTYAQVYDDGQNSMTREQEIVDYTPDSMWHRYDFYLDYGKKTLNMYMDGAELGNAEINSNGIKALAIRTICNNVDEYTVSVDNWYVNWYAENENETPMMIADKTSVQYGEELEISFSESLDGSANSRDFIIKNAAGENVDGEIIATPIGVRGAKVTLPKLADGKYTLVLEELTGSVSEKTFSPLSFEVSTPVAVTDTYYYVNEDFDDYQGGIPGGWNGPFYDWAGDDMYNKVTATEGKTGNALSFNGPALERYLVKEFASPITGGSFTIEFDAYGNNSGIALGFLNEGQTKYSDLRYVWQGDFTNSWKRGSETVNSVNLYAKWREDNNKGDDTDANWNEYLTSEASLPQRTVWKKNDVYSNMFMFEDNEGNILSAKGRASWWYPPEAGISDTSLDTTADRWNHFEIVVDLDNEKYTFYINDPEKTSGKTVEFDACRFSTFNNAYLDTQGGNGKTEIKASGQKETTTKFLRYFANGITGIRLGQGVRSGKAVPENPVKVDNLKVYSNNSYNMYQDYDNLTKDKYGSSTGALGWYNVRYAGTGWRVGTLSKYQYTENETSGTGINMLNGNGGANIMARKLDKPVKAGTPFTVEFKILTNSGSKQNAWAMGIGSPDYAMSTAEVEEAGINSDTNVNGTVVSAYTTWQGMTILNNAGNNWTTGTAEIADGGALYYQKSKLGAGGTAAQYNGSNITYKHGEWNYVKLEIEPLASGANYTLSFKNSTTGGDYVRCQTYNDVNAEWGSKDADFIYFFINNGGNYYLDDVKVYESKPAQKLSVLDVKTVSVTGDKATFAGSFDNTMTGFEITFSDAIASTDGITLRKTNGSTKWQNVAVTKTLSEDKKTVTVGVNGTLSDGVKYLLNIDGVTGVGSVLGGVDTRNDYFTYNANAAETDKIVITDAWVEGYFQDENAKDAATKNGTWVRLADGVTLNNVQKLNFCVKGYNTNQEGKLLTVVGSYYDSTLQKADCADPELPHGVFEKAIVNISPIKDAKIKFFVWNADSCEPLMGAIQMSPATSAK